MGDPSSSNAISTQWPRASTSAISRKCSCAEVSGHSAHLNGSQEESAAFSGEAIRMSETIRELRVYGKRVDDIDQLGRIDRLHQIVVEAHFPCAPTIFLMPV